MNMLKKTHYWCGVKQYICQMTKVGRCFSPTNPGWHRGTEICPALPANIQALGQLFLEDFFPVELRLLVISSTGVGHIVPMFLSYCCFNHTWSADCCVSMVYEPREPCNGPKCKEETTMNDAVRTAACAQ